MNKQLARALQIVLGGFLLISAVVYVINNGFALPEPIDEVHQKHPKPITWSFDGPLGTVDKQSAQRGYQVYKEVCASCHSMNLVSFRNLTGIGFSEAEAKAIAAEYNYKTINDDGDEVDRPGVPNDKFPSPYANKQAAAFANNGAVPPDLSLIIKARHDGANYVYSLLTGYSITHDYVCTGFDEKGACVNYRLATDTDKTAHIAADKKREELIAKAKADKTTAPLFNKDADKTDMVYSCIPHSAEEAKNPAATTEHCSRLNKGMSYNPYFPGGQIAMPKPLSDGQVTYQDGTNATLDQEARDLVNFLQYTAEPEMEERKHMGIKIMLFLAVMTVFFYIAKVRIWARVK